MHSLDPAHLLRIAAVAAATALLAVAPAAAHDGPSLSGQGTPVLDGVIGPGEWSTAARYDFSAAVPPNDGGGTTPATLFVMNDEHNLYLALELTQGGPPRGSFSVEFDNDHDGVPFEEGEDVFVANPGVDFFDDFRTSLPPCPANVICGLLDTQAGGTSDGRSVASGNGTVQVYEVERPLDSADDLHDFSLAIGSTVGFHASIQVWSVVPSCNFGPSCLSTTRIPAFGTGDITIAGDGSGPPGTPALELDPGVLSLEVAEGAAATAPVTVRNASGKPVDITVGEAPADCDAPADVGWLAVGPAFTLAAGASAGLDVAVDSAGLAAPDLHTAKLCLELGDGAVVDLPVTLRALYPFSGFLATFANPPVLNAAHSDGVQTFWFRLGGDRGTDVVSDASSREIDCVTREATGPLEPAETPSWDGLFYQAHTGRYAYPWKTSTAFEGTCRELVLTLADESVHTATLHFVK